MECRDQFKLWALTAALAAAAASAGVAPAVAPAPPSIAPAAGFGQLWEAESPPASQHAELSIEDEVLTNILRQPIGGSGRTDDGLAGQTVADLNLPEPFLRRAADRIIRSSFQARYRIVVRDQDDGPAAKPDRGNAHQTDATGHEGTGQEGMRRGLLVPDANSLVPNALLPDGFIKIVHHDMPEPALRYRASLPEARPPLRGFRAPLLLDNRGAIGQGNSKPVQQPFALDGSADSPKVIAAARIVGKRLAFDGLLFTTALAIEALGPQQFLEDGGGAGGAAGARGGGDPGGDDLLAHVGLPVDLLRYFHADLGDQPNVVTFIAQKLAAGHRAQAIKDELQATFRFQFRQSRSGFQIATESGEHEIQAIRLQLTRGSYWEERGDGGNVDIARQLVEQLPNVSFIASIEKRFVDEFTQLARTWKIDQAPGRSTTTPAGPSGGLGGKAEGEAECAAGSAGGGAARLTVVAEPFVIAQWAQDNGKVGLINDQEPARHAEDARRGGGSLTALGDRLSADGRQPAADGPAAGKPPHMIVPRYASRGEDGSTFVPGETFLLDGLRLAGLELFQSPLLFQGGNLLAVQHPKTGERILLIGEAEVYRNTALGLTAAQALEAFAIEFGVDRCQALPAVSFHIDYDLTVRAVGDKETGKLLAFVNNPDAAVKIILECATDVLESNHLVSPASAQIARDHARAGRLRQCVDVIGEPILARSDGAGHFPLSFAKLFSTDQLPPVSRTDSAVGNFQRLLFAMDWAAGLSLTAQEMPDDPHARSYIQSLSRLKTDMDRLREQLAGAGFEVVDVPSISEEGRSMNYLNGIHERRRYLMPSYAGGGTGAGTNGAGHGARQPFSDQPARIGSQHSVVEDFLAKRGLYAALDDAAASVFRNALGGDVEVRPIVCSESQRRVGALHCSCTVFPSSR